MEEFFPVTRIENHLGFINIRQTTTKHYDIEIFTRKTSIHYDS